MGLLLNSFAKQIDCFRANIWVLKIPYLLHTLSYLIFRKTLWGKSYPICNQGSEPWSRWIKNLPKVTTKSGRSGIWTKLMFFTISTLSPCGRLSPFLAQIFNSTYFLQPSVTHSMPRPLSEGVPSGNLSNNAFQTHNINTPITRDSLSKSCFGCSTARLPQLAGLSAQIWSQLQSTMPHAVGLPLQTLNNCQPWMNPVPTLSLIAKCC